MFNHAEHCVKADAENKAGAIAHLLTSRKGGWFTFDIESGSDKKECSHPYSVTRFLYRTQIYTVDGNNYSINKETYHKLLAVMKNIEGLAEETTAKSKL